MIYDESMDETEIINDAKRDYRAFDYLYEKYMPQIFNYVMFRVYQRETAEDIVSIVFFKAMKNLGMFHWRKIPFSAWLYRIAFNEICNYSKKEKKHEKIKKDYASTNPEDSYEHDFDQVDNTFAFVHEYLVKLPPKELDLITQRYFERRSFAEISQITGKNESTLRVNLHRALKKLESLMPQEVLEHAYRQISM
jgi:RNA polymerase sigma-70 factor (ECF subfamily)